MVEGIAGHGRGGLLGLSTMRPRMGGLSSPPTATDVSWPPPPWGDGRTELVAGTGSGAGWPRRWFAAPDDAGAALSHMWSCTSAVGSSCDSLLPSTTAASMTIAPNTLVPRARYHRQEGRRGGR